MKRLRLETGLALAIIAKDGVGPHGLIHLLAPVDWTDFSARFDSFLNGRAENLFTLKAAVSSDTLLGLQSWLSSRKLALSGERILKTGEAREIHFFEDTGRLSIEVAPATAETRVEAPRAVSIATPVKNATPARTELPKSIPSADSSKVVTVLIVDDSKAMRMVLRKILETSPRLRVIGEAGLPSEALAFLEKQRPDVLTLDIQMPEMSGVELFKKISKLYKIPAVMVSALGMNEGHEVMDALEAGAFDYFQKPEGSEIQAQAPVLHEKVIQAALSSTRVRSGGGERRGSVSKSTGGAPLAKMDILAIGSSTGGTEAVRCIFEALPADIPPIVVVQHIPPFFSAAFAERLDKLCKFEVREAKEGDELRRGLALIAPGGLHLEVARSGRKFVAKITDAPPVNRFRPSVDVLYRSVVREFGKDMSRVTGIILTGMGNDGAQGLLELRKAGARTIGQDEDSSVVYGMPRAAAEIGAVEEVSPLDEIALLLTKERRKNAA